MNELNELKKIQKEKNSPIKTEHSLYHPPPHPPLSVAPQRGTPFTPWVEDMLVPSLGEDLEGQWHPEHAPNEQRPKNPGEQMAGHQTNQLIYTLED